jgi:acyl-CoA synthetase (AMP-forming)/AMP-acid ligase II
VTVLQATPATWRLLLDHGWTGGLRVALCGGETVPRTLADELLARADSVWNVYGPTETTVWSTAHRITAGEGRVPVGRPWRNTSVYVLDGNGRPVPQGVPGEVWIGGDGVASGYWQRDALTRERFLPDPYTASSSARMYRTGDIGRWRADGSLDHLGRGDAQVKVHGFRIELGEVEAALEALPEVQQAAADARGEGSDRRLLAWVTVADGVVPPPTSSELRRALRQVLPPHLVPALIVVVPEIPLTLNGKVDRRALADPLSVGTETATVWEPPEGPIETAIAEEWQRLLGVPRVSRHDNFFELGGHSLLSLQSIAAIERRTGRRLDPRRFFYSTLAQLAG